MKIFFIGTVDFSYQMLDTLISLRADIVGVATKEKSNINSDHVDLSELCHKHNIPYNYINNINAKENLYWINSLNPDIIFCFGWSYLLKKELLNLTPMGVVGFHPTELPKNRGRHPIIWSLVLGLSKTASTFFFMREGADDGPILSQKLIKIRYEDYAQSLYDKIITSAKEQIKIFLPKLENKNFKTFEQDHSKSNLWRKRGVNDGLIDFRMSSFAIYNLVRGLGKPYVGAHLIYDNKEVKVWKVEEVKDMGYDNIEPGKILEIKDNQILVKCYDGLINLISHEFDTPPKIGEYL